MKRLGVGIAGYGYSAKTFHIPFLLNSDKFVIKKIYTRNETFYFNKEQDIVFVYDYAELMTEDIDIVIICTPNPEHFWMAKEAILSHKNVIVEKPITITSNEAMQLKILAQEHGVIVSSFQNRRLDGGFLTAKKIIEDDILGEIKEYESHFDRFVIGKNKKNWKNHKQDGVNILYDLGVHLLDQVYYLFGMPNEIYADFLKQRIDTPDFDRFNVSLYYEDFVARVQASEIVPEQAPCIIIRGEKGSFIKYGMDVQESELREGKIPINDEWGLDKRKNFGNIYFKTGEHTIQKPIETIRGDYGFFYENFYDVIINGAKPLVDMNQSIDVLKLIEAAMASNNEKRRIRLV